METPKLSEEGGGGQAWQEIANKLNQELGIADDPERKITLDAGRGHFIIPIFDEARQKSVGENFVPFGDALRLDKVDIKKSPRIEDVLRAVQKYPRLGTKEALRKMKEQG